MKMHVLRDFRQAVIRSIRTKAIKAMPAFKPGGAGGNCGTGAGGFKPGNVCAAGGLGSMAKHPGVQSAQQGEFAKALVTSASVWNTGTVAAQAKAKAEVMAEAIKQGNWKALGLVNTSHNGDFTVNNVIQAAPAFQQHGRKSG